MNLPAAVSSFVGRDKERAAVVELVRGGRLVSLTGGPGAGKSRLALEVASMIGRSGGVSVTYANLGTDVIDQPEAAPPSPEDIATQLRPDIKLLVVDHADHVLGACRALSEGLLATHPDLHILLTSREPSGVTDEVIWRVPPLTTPPAGLVPILEELAAYDSVALFVDRARALRADFCLDDGSAGAVAEICRRLEGNPLALELAAGCSGVLSATEITEYLDDLDEILQPGRTMPSRHRSLTTAIAWSHDVASIQERTLLRRLSVFAGGFTLEAAQDVCAGEGLPRTEVARHLERLVARSLVETVSTTAAGPSRFGLTGPIRRFARDRLVEASEQADFEALHAGWCVVFASAKTRSHGGGNDEAWMERLKAEHDNVCAAFEWAVTQGRAKAALRLARGQMLFWQMSGRFAEAMEWLEKVLAVTKDAPAPLRAPALHDAGYVAMLLGEFATARAHLEEAVELFSNWPYSKGQSSARTLLGFMVSFSADRPGLQILEETLAEARVAGDHGCVSETLVAYGRARLFRGATSVAERSFAEAIEVARAQGQRAADAVIGLGWVALVQGRYDEAEAALSKGVAMARRSTDAHATAVGLMWSGELARRRASYGQARSLLGEARQLVLAMGTLYPLATSLMGLGSLALAEGDNPKAAALFEDQLGLARRAGLAFLIAPALVGLAQAAWASGDLGDAEAHLSEAFDVAYDHDDRWAIAAALHASGGVTRARGDSTRAAALHHRALALQQETGDAPGMVASVEALAGLAAVDSGTDAAAMVLGAAAEIRKEREYPRSHLEEQTYASAIAGLENTMGAERLQAAWERGRNLSLSDAVTYASRDFARRASPSSGWASLSPLECEAAALVEQGLSNPQIAERLQLSTETVKSRVSTVFSKLGISSRQELAQAVRQRTGVTAR